MADDTSLTTSTRVNLYLGKTGTSALVTDLITLMDGWIQSYCNRKFITQANTNEMYDGDNTDTLIVRQYPIITVTSIYLNNELLASTSYDDTTNKKSGLYLNSGMITRIDGGAFCKGHQNVWITYKSGYVAIPAEISLVATQMICDLYNNPGDVSSERIGQYSISYKNLAEGVLPVRYSSILDKYKKR